MTCVVESVTEPVVSEFISVIGLGYAAGGPTMTLLSASTSVTVSWIVSFRPRWKKVGEALILIAAGTPTNVSATRFS